MVRGQRCRFQLALILEGAVAAGNPTGMEIFTRTSYPGRCYERKLRQPQARRIIVVECASLLSNDFILSQCTALPASVSVLFITYVIVAAGLSHPSLNYCLSVC